MCIRDRLAATPAASSSSTYWLDFRSSTTLTSSSTIITCDENNPQWATLSLAGSSTALGDGLSLDAASKLLTVDETSVVVVRGTAKLNTCYGTSGTCYTSTPTQSNTLRVLNGSTKARVAALASVSGVGYDLFNAPMQTISNTTFTVPAGSSFGFVFSTTFCSWVNWSLLDAVTVDVYRRILVTKSPTFPIQFVSSTTFSTPTTAITCNAQAANWAVLHNSTALGSGLYLNAASNLLTVDADTSFIVVRGTARLNTCYGASGSCYAGTHTNPFRVFSDSPRASLADLASVTGSGTQLLYAPTQTIPNTTVIVPPGVSFGFVFFTTFCSWVNWSLTDLLVIDLYKENRPPTMAAPSRSPVTSKPSASPTPKPSKAPVTSQPSKSPITSQPSKSPTTSKPSSLPTAKPSARPSRSPSRAPTFPIQMVSSTTFSTPTTAITCNDNDPKWAVLTPVGTVGAGLTLVQGQGNAIISLDPDVAYIVLRGSAVLNTCYGAGGVCYPGQQTNSLRVYAWSPRTALATLASVSGDGYALFNAPRQTIPTTTLWMPQGTVNMIGFLFYASFCSWVNWSLIDGVTIDVYKYVPTTRSPTVPTTSSPSVPTVARQAPTTTTTAKPTTNSDTTASSGSMSASTITAVAAGVSVGAIVVAVVAVAGALVVVRRRRRFNSNGARANIPIATVVSESRLMTDLRARPLPPTPNVEVAEVVSTVPNSDNSKS